MLLIFLSKYLRSRIGENYYQIKLKKYIVCTLLGKDSVKLKIPKSLARRRCGKINMLRSKLECVSVRDYEEEKDAFIWELSSISPLREGLALSLPLFPWEEVVVT